MANRTKTAAWKLHNAGNCSKRTFQGRHHVSDHTKGYSGDSGGVGGTCEDMKDWRTYIILQTACSNFVKEMEFKLLKPSVISELECKFSSSDQSAYVFEDPELNGEEQGSWIMLLFH